MNSTVMFPSPSTFRSDTEVLSPWPNSFTRVIGSPRIVQSVALMVQEWETATATPSGPTSRAMRFSPQISRAATCSKLLAPGVLSAHGVSLQARFSSGNSSAMLPQAMSSQIPVVTSRSEMRV